VSRGAVPRGRAEWRAWVRAVNPGEVRRRAGVRQTGLAARIGVKDATLGGWERGSSCPGDPATGALWFEAVTEIAAALAGAGR
jgi:hypothetical protein